MKVWDMRDLDLPLELQTVRYIFTGQLADDKLGETHSPRARNESLHDFFTRKGLKCFCKNCKKERAKDVLSKQQVLLHEEVRQER